MTTQEFLSSATKTLEKAGVATARLDCLVLLEDALGLDRASILAHTETKLSKVTEVELNKKIAQRARHVPLAYIRGRAEFYAREFIVNRHVLVPRPETETMIDLLKKLDSSLLGNNATITDIGTGSGAIAITAKLELPKAKVIATDIDPEALRVARQNAQKFGADIEFLHGSLLEPLTPNLQRPVSIILANLPYVPERYAINLAAEHEPKHAIFAGKDGLNLYREFWSQIPSLPDKPAFILTESLPPQHAEMTAVADKAGYKLLTAKDLIQAFAIRD